MKNDNSKNNNAAIKNPNNNQLNEDRLKNGLNTTKNKTAENTNPEKIEDNNQNPNNNNEIKAETPLNSNSNISNNSKRESNLLRFSKLFKIRNELALMAQNLNLGDKSLFRSLDKSTNLTNNPLINGGPLGKVKLPPIRNPYEKNKHFKDLSYNNRPKNYLSPNKIQNSFSLISDVSHSYSINSNIFNNRMIRSNILNSIIKKGKISAVTPDSSRLLTENIINTMKNKVSKTPNIDVKKIEIITIDNYNAIKTETMAQYKHDNKQRSDEDDEKNGKNNNNSLISSGKGSSISRENSYAHESSLIQVNVKEKSFLNPSESIDIIKTNRFIHDNISSSLIDIQKIYYDKTIKSIEYLKNCNKKMQKVRVSVLVSKNAEVPTTVKTNGNLITEVVNEDPEKEKEEEDENLFDEFRDDYILKKKEKEKQKIKNLQVKKDEVKSKNRITKVDDWQLYATYKYSSKNFPEGREQFSFRYNLVDIVLFGGLVMNKTNNYLWVLDPNTLEWERILCDNSPVNPRYGHTGILYQKKFVVFGGKVKSGNYQYLADIDIFDMIEKTWTQPNFSSKSHLCLRRNHVAELVGHQILVHGGMSEENQVLSDCHVLSLNPYKWNYATISDITPSPALAGHACALVVPSEYKYNARMNLYKYPDIGFGKLSSNKIRERGWYIFGGIDSEGNFCNDIWILRIGKKPLEWIKPLTRGKIPRPRYSHSMNYFEDGNFLIVHGGRNDFSSDSFAFNDTYIFDLQKLEWQEILLYSDIPNFEVFNRCGHCAVVYTNKLIIFGGMNNMNYIGSSLFIINLDFNFKYYNENEEDRGYEVNRYGKNSNGRGGSEKKEFFLPPIK